MEEDKLIDEPGTVSNTAAKIAGAVPSGGSPSLDETVAMSFLFYVKIDGVTVGVFTECIGISAKRDVETFREGGVNDYAHVLPGPLVQERITLKRGVTLSKELWNWFETGEHNLAVSRHTLTITQEASGADKSSGGRGIIKTWSVKRAFPVSWKMSDLSAGNSTLVFETLELAHEGISLQS